MSEYNHCVCLDINKCTGCTTCMKYCPTEAIRILNSKAKIDPDKCIDCGECIRVCQNHAKKSDYDSLGEINNYKYKVALPAPSLFAQFDNLDDIDIVMQGLIDLGFDDVFEVGLAAEIVSAYTRTYLKTEGIKKPVISTACPVIARLVALRFPFLKDNLIPLLPPIEIAAQMARDKAKKEHPELNYDDICICFISPCPAKVSFIRNGFGSHKSRVTLAVSMSEIYFKLINVMQKRESYSVSAKEGRVGLSWAMCGGEASALLDNRIIAADGIRNVINVLDQIEDGKIPNVNFVELNACPGGCVGGVMAIENPYIAKNRLHSLRRFMPVTQENLRQYEGSVPDSGYINRFPDYKPLNRLSDNIGESMRLLGKIQQIKNCLPGIDCGACGAPSCRAFAEDLVKGIADENDCIIAYKDLFKQYIDNYDKYAKGAEDEC